MVTDFMEQGELDLVDEVLAVAAVIEKRQPVEQDDIGQDISIPAAPLIQRNTGVEAVQGVGTGIEVEIAEGIVVRPVLDLDGDIFHEFGEFIGEAIESV